MAVRNDFTAGEVLAAADLNDTFASKLPYSYGTATPSTTDSGFLWYDSNSTPAQPKHWNGSSFIPVSGLTLITSQTFSAVSSVALNGCFTSTFANYRIIILSDGTDFPNLQIRWRVSGSDDATSNSYSSQRLLANSTTISGARTTGTAGILGTLVNGLNVYAFDAYRPALSTDTQTFSTNVLDESSGVQLESYATRHNQATAYDGFSLIPASGTITGTVRVYGYKD